MSSPYEKILKRGAAEKEAKKKNASYNAHLHMISFDDSDDSSRVDIPNIFLDDRENHMESYAPSPPPHPKPQRKPKEVPPVRLQPSSAQEFDITKSPTKRLAVEVEHYHEPQPEEIAEPEPNIHAHSSLSMLEIIKLNLGEYLFRNSYPIKKTIYINNNNEEENELNQKEFQLKNQNEKEMLHFNNSLESGAFLFILALLVRNIFGYLYVYCWVSLIALQFVAEMILLEMPIQYGNDKASIIVLLVLSVSIQTVSDWLSFRKRRHWQDSQHAYRIYHHNGHMAEWVHKQSTEIKAGNIFKLQPGEIFPTDSLLLYSERSLVKIDQTSIICQLIEHPSQITLKESLIKQESIPLPISGCFVYEISNPEHTDFQIVGKLNLEEPAQHSHGVSMANVVLRGCVNVSDVEVVCMAMQTSIDSLLLKSIQYPYTQRRQHDRSSNPRRKQISDKTSQQILKYENTFLGLPIQNKLQSIIHTMFLVYFLMLLFGLLVNFCYSLTTPNEYFMPQTTIPIWKIAIYHATNFIILVPVTLVAITKLFIALSGMLIEHNISCRQLEIQAEEGGNRHKRASSLMESTSSKMEELLDNKKIIFPLTIKDYNLLPELSKIDTIVTTIDTFRDYSAFTLHSIRFKEINHNFITNSLDNEAYSVSDLEQMKYFMSVSLLSSTKNEYQPEVDEPSSYDTCIESAAKKHFDLQKLKNARDETRIGSEFMVKELFHIDPVYEYPYKVVFLEPVVTQIEHNNYIVEEDENENESEAMHVNVSPNSRNKNSRDSKNILVLIRGDPKVMLDKCYGKSVGFTEESRKLQEEKGFHVQLLGKLTLHMMDVTEIKKAYESPTMNKGLFYKNLDKYISKVQSMGLLIFVNQFHQKKIGSSLKNPVLNRSMNDFHQPPRQEDTLSSQMMPNVIVLAPWSKSKQPEFESIHTITNLLISPYLFNLSLSQVGDKIYHERPGDLDRMFTRLNEQKVLVWNNWEQKDISYTLQVMKQYGHNIMFYTQKDEYLYLMKQTDCSVKGSSNGYDASKFSDINLTSRCSISYLYMLQLIRYDSVLVRQGAISLLFTHVGKFVFYVVVEFLQLFYTRGTGLMIIKTPLFLVVEGVLFLDVLYYLNWKDSGRAYSFPSSKSYSRQILMKIGEKTLQGLIITLITIYSTQTPSSSDGTPHTYHYTYFTIVFILLHVLILEKIFNISVQAFSVYKGIVLLGQIVMTYVGFVIVSVLDTYHYKGILWSALKAGNVWVTIIVLVWISLTFPAIRWLWSMLRHKGLRKREQRKLI